MSEDEALRLLYLVESWVESIIALQTDPNGEDWGDGLGKSRRALAKKISELTQPDEDTFLTL